MQRGVAATKIVRVLVLVLEGLVQSVTKHRPRDEANKSNM
jgi:hypothetical protein